MIGNLVADPEARTTKGGKSQSNFRIAVQRHTANAQGVREADFFDVVAWDKSADFANRFLSKGRKVAIEGSLRNRAYEAQDGSKRRVTEIVVDNVEALDGRGDRQQQQSPSHHNDEFVEVDPDEELPF